MRRAGRGGGGQPSARGRDDGHGVGAFGPGGQAEAFPREADHGEGGGGAGQGWPPGGVGGVADPGGDQVRPAVVRGASSER